MIAMRCRYTNKPCPYSGIGSGCMGSGCPELDYLYDDVDELDDPSDDEPDYERE